MNIKRSEAIKKFLELKTWPDLAALYSAEMEVQVNVARDNGERVDKHYKGRDYHGYTDGDQTWSSFRMPLNAMSDPEDNDTPISFDLMLHAEGIGLTGWNWVQRRSIWVAYDFDSLLGHSEKHQKKLTDQEIDEIKERIKGVDWVTLRQSTGGRGLHLYVFIAGQILIKNHSEHMALGRAILSQLSAIANFDFESRVDTNAGNMWVWHRKMIQPGSTELGDGLKLIKQGVPLENIPSNWQDYIDVVRGKRKRAVPFFTTTGDNPEQEYDQFEELSNQRPKIPLDDDHRKLLAYIEKHSPGGSWWQDTQWMLVTHTALLKQAHAALNLKGIFETSSPATNVGEQNLFAFPLPYGAWIVRRYTKGVAEHKSWCQDGQGYTYCYYNRLPDLKTAANIYGGIETKAGGYSFTESKSAIAAAKMLGSTLTIPERMGFRQAVLKPHKGKRLIIEIQKEKTDSVADFPGFDGSNRNHWSKIIDSTNTTSNGSIEGLQLDKTIRHIVNEGGKDEGWVVRSDNIWRTEPLEHIKLMLKGAFGYGQHESNQILGTGAIQPYTLVNRPFDVEYPPGRLWNRKGAKFKYTPSQNLDDLKFPTWLRVFEHLGRNLNSFLSDHPWARANNIKTGADYLFIWVAALLQKPYERLPYLFFYSVDQNTGKSTFHECIARLLHGDPPNGYMKVSEALRATANFNAELHYAILCVVEELDLNPKRPDAKISYNRIKELVTAELINITEKNKTPCMVRNCSHWCQCSNDKTACPIFKDDTRITMIRVNPIDSVDMIPKPKLMQSIELEAPDFLAYVLNLEIPPSNDRLMVPVIETEDKKAVQGYNQTLVEHYIAEQCHEVDGEMILWADFYQTFLNWMEPDDIAKWTKRYTGLHLPEKYPRAKSPKDAQYYIANISRSPRDPEAPIKPKLIAVKEYLRPADY